MLKIKYSLAKFHDNNQSQSKEYNVEVIKVQAKKEKFDKYTEEKKIKIFGTREDNKSFK